MNSKKRSDKRWNANMMNLATFSTKVNQCPIRTVREVPVTETHLVKKVETPPRNHKMDLKTRNHNMDLKTRRKDQRSKPMKRNQNHHKMEETVKAHQRMAE